MNPMDEFDRKDAGDERSHVNRMKADAMRLIEEIDDNAFVAWYIVAFPAMNEAATSSISTAALMDAPEDIFNEWLRDDENDAIAIHDTEELQERRFAAVTLYHEEPCF